MAFLIEQVGEPTKSGVPAYHIAIGFREGGKIAVAEKGWFNVGLIAKNRIAVGIVAARRSTCSSRSCVLFPLFDNLLKPIII